LCARYIDALVPTQDHQGRPDGRRLLLLRHATASYDDPALDDHDAPLSERAQGVVWRLGTFMVERGYRPTHVLCSSARRTQETFERLAPRLGGEPALHVLPELYLASPSELLAHIEAAPQAASTLLVVAHNPGISSLAHYFAEGADPALRQRILDSFPPAAFAAFGSPARSWDGFEDARSLLDFVRPNDLPAS
jgi:phosphohistidine phosphatase